MGLEDRALARLDWMARTINERGFRASVRSAVKTRLERVTVQVLDQLVERVTQSPIRTQPHTRPAPTPTRDPDPPPLRPSDIDGLRPLDERSGIDRLVLLERSPQQAFAYWETESTRLRALAGKEQATAELRLLDLDDRRLVSRTEVTPEHGRLYLELPERSAKYLAELVVSDASEEVLVSRSRPLSVSCPEVAPAPDSARARP